MLQSFETMVDSRKGGVMADRIDHLTERVQVVEQKVDQLSTTVSALSESVAAGFVEQREYTEFSHARLEAKMDAGFARVDRIERKLVQFIDVQLQTNALVERRLNER
jgi:hypothetical protein